MRKILFLFIYLAVIGCNTKTDLLINEFNWHLELPTEMISRPKAEIEKLEAKGEKMIEEAYNQKIKIVALPLFHYEFPNVKYNNVQAQYSKLESKEEFLEEYKKANEIVVKTFKNVKPDANIETKYSTKKIDGLEFRYFELISYAENGTTTSFINYSRLFGLKKLDILVVYQNKKKGIAIQNAIENSRFE